MTTDKDIQDNWMGSRDAVIERLQLELESDRATAETLAAELAPLHASLRSELLAWWNSETVDLDKETQGWSIRKLIAGGHSRHVSQAFTWLNGLVTEPEETLAMLAYPRCVIDFTTPSSDDE